MKQSTRPAAVTAAVILVLELAGAAFWGHAALAPGGVRAGLQPAAHRGAGAGGAPLMLAGAAYLLLWALDRLFLSPYSWQKKTDVASKTRPGEAPLCPSGGWPAAAGRRHGGGILGPRPGGPGSAGCPA